MIHWMAVCDSAGGRECKELNLCLAGSMLQIKDSKNDTSINSLTARFDKIANHAWPQKLSWWIWLSSALSIQCVLRVQKRKKSYVFIAKLPVCESRHLAGYDNASCFAKMEVIFLHTFSAESIYNWASMLSLYELQRSTSLTWGDCF